MPYVAKSGGKPVHVNAGTLTLEAPLESNTGANTASPSSEPSPSHASSPGAVNLIVPSLLVLGSGRTGAS